MEPAGIPYARVEAIGNDFILTSREVLPHPPDSSLARTLCDRREGIGADGWILLSSGPKEWRIEIFNADGSHARQCGNGLRCVARYLAEQTGKEHFLIHSPSGEHEASILEDGEVSVTLGPSTVGDSVEIVLEGRCWRGRRARVGNPHLVILVEALPDDDTFALHGRGLSTHPMFADGINVEMAAVESPREVSLLVWERGAGATRACGSGAAAVVAVAQESGLVEDRCRVKMPGGDLVVERSVDGQTTIIGEAKVLHRGKIPAPLFR